MSPGPDRRMANNPSNAFSIVDEYILNKFNEKNGFIYLHCAIFVEGIYY